MIQNRIKARAAILLVALLISSGLFAQKSLNYFEVKNVSNEILRSSYDILAEIKSAFETDFFFEEPIKLEEWMLDLNLFAKDSKDECTSVENNMITNFEDSQDIEDLMMETDWNYILNENFKDEVLKLEKWMCCPDEWII